MDSGAQTPAVARLERAIESLEAAVSQRRQVDDEASSASSREVAEHHDLSQRHQALKSSVSAALGDIDALLEAEERADA